MLPNRSKRRKAAGTSNSQRRRGRRGGKRGGRRHAHWAKGPFHQLGEETNSYAEWSAVLGPLGTYSACTCRGGRPVWVPGKVPFLLGTGRYCLYVPPYLLSSAVIHPFFPHLPPSPPQSLASSNPRWQPAHQTRRVHLTILFSAPDRCPDLAFQRTPCANAVSGAFPVHPDHRTPADLARNFQGSAEVENAVGKALDSNSPIKTLVKSERWVNRPLDP